MTLKNFLILSFLFFPAASYAAPGTSTTSHALKKRAAVQTIEHKGGPSAELNEEGVEAVRAKDFKRAEELFLKSLSADRNNLTAAYNLAGMYLTNKKEEAAITLLKGYASEEVKDGGIYARLGDAYFAHKEPKAAAEQYEKALALDPSLADVHARLGTVYLLLNRVPEAEKSFLVAVQHSPQNAKLLGSLSSVFLANHKPEEAISTAKRALQITASPEFYITMGSAYEDLQDYKNALIAFQRAADLGDKRPELQEKLKELKAQG